MTFRRIIPALSFLALTVCVPPADAQQSQIRIEWSSNVTEYRGQNGRRLTMVCPPGGSVSNVYGTDTYTDDSHVCSAAVHAGVIAPAAGGVVTIEIAPGAASYQGSTRNAVTSNTFGQWGGSFVFDRSNGEGRVDWKTAATGLSLAGKPLTVVCPAGGVPSNVWGTDIYTDDSSICSAAVHAGLISFASGGRVTIEGAGEQALHPATARNGVTSQAYDSWPNSFRFSGSVAASPAPAVTAVEMPIAPVAATPATTAPATATPATATPSTATLATARPASERAPTSVTPPETVRAEQPTSIASATSTQSRIAGARTGVAGPAREGISSRAGTGGAPASLAAPTGVRAEPLYYRGSAMVHWDKMPGAVGYYVVVRKPDGQFYYASDLYKADRSQGVALTLAEGPATLSVMADYGSGQLSTPGIPVSVTIPRWKGEYRISLLGFKVERETSDDPAEIDGKRDEIYLRAAVAQLGPDGNRIGSIVQRQTRVHGDINTSEWSNPNGPNRRVKAGSASVYGGLRTGDAYPTSTPWQRSTSSNFTEVLPLQLWEGYLGQGDNTVQVAFNLWESDQRPGQSVPTYSSFSPEASALERAGPAAKRLEPTLAGKVVTAAAAGVVLAPSLGVLLVLSSPALVPAVAMAMAAEAITPRLPVIPKAATPLDGLADQIGITAASLSIQNALAGAANDVAIGVSNFVAEMESNLSMTLNIKDRPLGVRTDAQGNLSAIPGTLTLTFESAEGEALAGNGPAGKGPGIYEYRFTDAITSQGGNGIYVVYLQVERR